MAKLKFAQHYDNWTSGLLGRFDPDDVVTADASAFKVVIADDYDDPPEIQGWSVTYKAASGSKFKYSVNPDDSVKEAVSGKLGSIEVRDDSGALVMKITGIKGVDIGNIYNYIVNRPDSPNSDPERIMEYVMRGDDKLVGTKNDDQFGINYNGGDDVYKGNAGFDYFEAGAGNDTIKGGADFDTVSYQSTMWNFTALHGAKIDLSKGEALDPWGGTDVFDSVESFRGSHFADTFKHSGEDPVTFFGVMGGKGADTFKFDAESNVYVLYRQDQGDGGNRGIVADLGGRHDGKGNVKGTVTDGWGHTDKTVNVRKIEGTDTDDSFKGSRLADHFTGRDGTDTYDGRKGVDWVHFDSGDGGPVNIDLSLNSGQIIDDGFGRTENATSIEAVIGSFDDDVIVGSSGKNEILGGGGDDTLTGGNGKDKFIFGNYHGNGFHDTITDFASGKDKLVFDRAYIDDLDAKVRFINGDEATSGKGKSQFYFNDDDHSLYLDVNGKDDGGVQKVAVLEGVTSLQKSDILIVEHYIDVV